MGTTWAKWNVNTELIEIDRRAVRAGRSYFAIRYGETNTEKAGLRVRQGLGTDDEVEADRLVAQLNELLANPKYWDKSARPTAELNFDERVVEIFYYKIVPESVDFAAIRNEIIPLPTLQDGYRRLLLAGATGSGKTTLVRQFLGMDPKRDRFPSTSTAKTTVADMEVVLIDGQYRAAVTFLPKDQIRDYVEECMSAAALSGYRGDSQEQVLRRLLSHVSERFRLNYLLGSPSVAIDDEEQDYDDDDEGEDKYAVSSSAELGSPVDLTRALLDLALTLCNLAKSIGAAERAKLVKDHTDESTFDLLFDESFDDLIRENDVFTSVADQIMDMIEERASMLETGELRRSKQGWPQHWSWETDDRERFLAEMRRFTSNHHRLFGSLLTPIVNGVRIAGPFSPLWSLGKPALVIFDGEGLGHTPSAAMNISTSLTRRIDEVDAVVLVDNALQPMLAAPAAFMSSVATSGKAAKLFYCFTHFDGVSGDNLPTVEAKQQHVLQSAENVLRVIREQSGAFAERILRKRLEEACFFVGGMQDKLDPHRPRGKRSIDQLNALIQAVEELVKPRASTGSRPIYDKINLVLALQEGTDEFHDYWLAVLGKESSVVEPPQHWARIKALSRRFAEGWTDEYDRMKPVADLHRRLGQKISLFIHKPLGWRGTEPSEDQKQIIFDELKSKLSDKFLEIASTRLRVETLSGWQDAYKQRGPGSTKIRSSIIVSEVYEVAAPIPSATPSLDRNEFFHEVLDAVSHVASRSGVEIR